MSEKKEVVLRSHKIKLIILIIISLNIYFPGCSKDKRLYENEVTLLQDAGTEIMIDHGVSETGLAYHWAPVHYQDINPVADDMSKVDWITRLDRDLPGKEGGDWNISKNWDRKLKYPLRAYVYFSIVTSDSHFYITYTFFHPWDTWVAKTNIDCEKSKGVLKPWKCKVKKQRYGWEKNDKEGVLLVINRKENKPYGKLEAVFAQSHGFIHTYLPQDNNIIENAKRLRPCSLEFSSEAQVSMQDNVKRVITTQEQGGHGAGCFPEFGAPSPNKPNSRSYKNSCKGGAGDHIRYIPSRTIAEEPFFDKIYIDENGNEKKGSKRYTYARYKLINMYSSDGGMWYHRDQPKVFEGLDRTFKGMHSTPFWNWRGDKEGVFGDRLNLSKEENQLVDIFVKPFTHNPAQLCWVYLSLKGDKIVKDYFSDNYKYNPFKKTGFRLSGNSQFRIIIDSKKPKMMKSIKRKFIIKNIGRKKLKINKKQVTVSGSNKFKVDFKETKTKLYSLESTTFIIEFTTNNSEVEYKAEIIIPNNSYTNNFKLVVKGIGVKVQ